MPRTPPTQTRADGIAHSAQQTPERPNPPGRREFDLDGKAGAAIGQQAVCLRLRSRSSSDPNNTKLYPALNFGSHLSLPSFGVQLSGAGAAHGTRCGESKQRRQGRRGLPHL